MGLLVDIDHDRVLRQCHVEADPCHGAWPPAGSGGELGRLDAVWLDVPPAPDPGHETEDPDPLGRDAGGPARSATAPPRSSVPPPAVTTLCQR